jgi:2-methylaconitate isomerase
VNICPRNYLYLHVCILIPHFVVSGSPDPDGRQIDGMGGGLSSLSKVVILSTPGETLPRGPEEGHLPTSGPTSHSFPDGIAWADDVEAASREDSGWDVVYRFAQVGIRDGVVDWGSTCGNLVAAVAHVRLCPLFVHRNALYDDFDPNVCSMQLRRA